MKTPYHIECARNARAYLEVARRNRLHPSVRDYWREQARRCIASGKQFRAIKRQNEMFTNLFRLASGGR